ncbi:MAG: hypothetical protein Q8L48_10715 [Archangium sp.]|nr:hypothetical protein [Archangium sp.]
MKPTRLSFFNEQDSPELTDLVGDAAVLRELQALKAGVTMGLRDLSDERAEAVRRLCGEGVPVGAWLLLPREQGYFATYDNVEAVEARVEAVLRWTERHSLTLTSLGFDFEPDLRELDRLFHHPVRALAGWARRSANRPRRERALESYRALISRLQSAGWSIETYQFPLLLEDRAAGSHFLQRFCSSLDVAVEREVVMTYSSLLGPLGPGLVEGWTRTDGAVAVGSTGGGVDPLPKLSFDELSRDLRLAARVCRDVSIFSLEGCVMHGHLPRLLDFDWTAPVTVPLRQRVGAASIRGSARALARLFR